MNILINDLPRVLVINNTEYKIRWGFRDCLRIMLAFEAELTIYEKLEVLLRNIYYDLPDDIEEAVKQANWFLNLGEDKIKDGPRLLSFEKDQKFIFAAFRQTHHIDLSTVDLHWWEFFALFMDLGSNTMFCQLTALRSRVKSGKASKEEMKIVREIGMDIFNVKDNDNHSLEEKEVKRSFIQTIKKAKQVQNG